MKSSEVWLSVVITCFLLHVINGDKQNYGNSSMLINNKENRGSDELLTASTKQFQASASSSDVANFLRYLNNSKILNIDDLSDTASAESNRRSDILTVAIPITELKSLQDSGFITRELSLSDLQKLTDNIQQYGITVDGYHPDAAHLVQKPLFANLPELPFDSGQFTKQDADQEAHYTKTGDENNFERNQANFQGYHKDANEYSVPNLNEHIESTAVDHNNYFPVEPDIINSENHNSYPREHPEDSRQSTKFLKDEALQSNLNEKNIFTSQNVHEKNSEEYRRFPQENNHYSNINRPIGPYHQIRNGEAATDKHSSNVKDVNFPQGYQEYSTNQKLTVPHNNENPQDKEIAFESQQSNYDDQKYFANYQQFPNKHHQSSVSYALPKTSDNAHFQERVANQNRRESNNVAHQLSTERYASTFGQDMIINRIGDAGVDLSDHTEEVTQGNYKGDDSSGRLGSIPGILGVDYPNYLSIPQTGFDCRQYNYPGYFADVEAQCQVYHICQADGRHNSFLCPLGTLFNQKVLVCDWWYNTDCASSDSYFDRNADLYQESINANNYKGHPQPNLQQTSTRSGRNFRGTGFSDSANGARINQNLNHFNGIPVTLRGNLANERNVENYDWGDIQNDFSSEPNAKHIPQENVEFTNDRYLSAGHYDRYKVERMDQNINSFNDFSETEVENLDFPNERMNNNQENNWEDITNDFSNEPTLKYVPERKVEIKNDGNVSPRKKLDNRRIENLPSKEKYTARSFGKNIDSWIRRDGDSNLKEGSTTFDENIFRSEERGKYNGDKYGVSDPPVESRIDRVFHKEILHSGIDAVSEILNKSFTSPGSYVKSEANLLDTGKAVENYEETYKSPKHESQYYDENVGMRQERENNHDKFFHRGITRDVTMQKKAFKSADNILKLKRNGEEDKEMYITQLKSTDAEESEEELEEYDEKPQIRETLKRDKTSADDDQDSTEYDKQINESLIQVFNPVVDALEHNERELTDERIVGKTSMLLNADMRSNFKRDSNKIKSGETMRPNDEESNNPYVPLTRAVHQRKDDDQRQSTDRNLGAINVSEISKPKSELDENKYRVKESVIKPQDVLGENERTKSDSAEEVPEVKKLDTGDIMSKTTALKDGIREILIDIASGDRLYKDILISEVISPHYRNSIRNGEQRSPSLKNIDRGTDTHKNNMFQNEDKFDKSETSSVIKTESNAKISKINKDFSDIILDTAESKLQENIRKPLKKIIMKDETRGKTYRRTSIKHPRNSARMSRLRFNDTARRRRLSRNIKYE